MLISRLSHTDRRKIASDVKSSRSDRAKHRDKERRREFSEKYSRTIPMPYVVSEDDSDSDGSYYARKMYEYRPKTSKGSSSRKAESRGTKDGDYTEGWESDKFESQHSNAFEYIQRSKGGVPIDSDRRPYTPWPSPTIHIETLHRDTARRSSARSRSARDFERPNSSGRERRGSFGVAESPLRNHSSRKIPCMPNATSAPAGLKIPSLKASHSTSTPRAATMLNNLHDKRDRPPVRRSETLPVPGIASRRADRPSSRPSKLKELYDSGYSSPGTPEMNQGSPPKSSKYMVVDENEDYSRGHRTILIDPNMPYRHKSTSPAGRDQPSMSARAMPRPSRSRTSYLYGDAAVSRDMPSRHETSRSIPSRTSPPLRSGTGRDGLFGEVASGDLHQRFPDDQIRFTPTISREDISFSRNSRQGSLDSHLQRDTYHRPGMVKNESSAY